MSTSSIVHRCKTDPAFASSMLRLQSSILASSSPGNLPQTYFGQNQDLTLDTRGPSDTCALTPDELDEIDRECPPSPSSSSSGRYKQQKSPYEGRMNEVQLISQGLAFCDARPGDAGKVASIINVGYASHENKLNETYRSRALKDGCGDRHDDSRGMCDIVDADTVRTMISSTDIKATLTQAPIGTSLTPSGSTLGCVIHRTSLSTNEVGESCVVCSVMYAAVKPQYYGLYVGTRMIKKVESSVLNSCDGVDRKLPRYVCFCVPSVRKSLIRWLERRGYEIFSRAEYPRSQVPFEVTDGVELVVMRKSIEVEKPQSSTTAEQTERRIHEEKCNNVKLNIMEEAEAAMRGLEFNANPNQLDFDDLQRFRK